jgi:hypothetical protein
MNPYRISLGKLEKCGNVYWPAKKISLMHINSWRYNGCGAGCVCKAFPARRHIRAVYGAELEEAQASTQVLQHLGRHGPG